MKQLVNNLAFKALHLIGEDMVKAKVQDLELNLTKI